MDKELKKRLEITAAKVRLGIIEGVYNAKSGHPGGSLGFADTLTYLYMARMNVSPDKTNEPDRDRFVLSKGHNAPVLYSVLAHRGFFPVDELKTLRKIGSRLQGHPVMGKVPGVDYSTGSLGQGISGACGMALAGKIDGAPYRVYTALGDGEIQEGQVWEAAMFAAHYGLDNLTAVVDNNNLQIDGPITEVMSPYPIDEKFKAFGWHVICIDGHDFEQIEAAFDEAEKISGKPVAIIQKTVKGKNVSFMENKAEWHGAAPNDEQYKIAVSELQARIDELEKEGTGNG
ncbi:MAG: transketolase [Oscillospiraceae bacterium]|nr:transketolase [Oscillospiraceae bacterium]